MRKNTDEDIENIARLLGLTKEGIKQLLSAPYVKDDTFVFLGNISQDNKNVETELLKIAGIQIKNKTGRIYPYGEYASHLIGYVQVITKEELAENAKKGYDSASIIGKTGLEKAYEDKLKGLNGYEIYISDAKGKKKKTIISRGVTNGEDLKLTIDINIQKTVYQQFKNDESATVVLNPKTGEILAMCSTPSYDSNDFILGMTNQKWQTISSDQSEPLYNRCQAVWTPGSSLKSITGAIALSKNLISEDEDFGASGKRWQKDTTWGPYHITTVKTYNGPANLRNALVYSDNIYFAKLALKIGDQTMISELKKLGFNSSINTKLSMTTSKFLSGDKFESEVQLADTGYGQGKTLVNPLHMAAMYTAFVNDGSMLMPYIEYKEDTTIPEYYLKNAFTEEAANTIKEDLIQVIDDADGTAHNAKIDGVILAGKTGTAEIKKTQEDEDGTEIGWFNVFVADENYRTQLLVVSMVEDVQTKQQSGYVTRNVKAILQKIL